MRQHLADIPLTDAFISIPGIEGGLSFDAQADLATNYRSTQITFGGDADPLTATVDHTLAYFAAGPSVDYFPRLEGRLDQTITLRITSPVSIACTASFTSSSVMRRVIIEPRSRRPVSASAM